jgi:hypothetical protein
VGALPRGRYRILALKIQERSVYPREVILAKELEARTEIKPAILFSKFEDV